MKHIALLATTACLLALPAAADTRNYDVGNFSEIDASRGVKVIYEAGDGQSIIGESERGDLDRLIIKTEDNRLIVSRKNSGNWFGGGNRDKFTVRVTAPAISAIDASSGSYVSATGVAGDTVELSASSGSTVDAGNVQGNRVSLDSSSGATLNAAGTCNEADAEASSGSSIVAQDLICSSVAADVSSGASINGHATASVRAEASSGGSIRINGGATDIESKKSSGGSVSVS